jgi:hypothetical protein
LFVSFSFSISIVQEFLSSLYFPPTFEWLHTIYINKLQTLSSDVTNINKIEHHIDINQPTNDIEQLPPIRSDTFESDTGIESVRDRSILEADLTTFRLHSRAAVSDRILSLQTSDGLENMYGRKITLTKYIRILSSCAWIGSNLFNFCLILYNFHNRPTRDSSVTYNFTLLFVIWSEFIYQLNGLFVYLCYLIFSLISQPNQTIFFLGFQYLIYSMGYNALTFIVICHPFKILQRLIKTTRDVFENIKRFKHQYQQIFVGIYILTISYTVIFIIVCMGGFGFVIKLSQVGFVGTTSPEQWNGTQWSKEIFN